MSMHNDKVSLEKLYDKPYDEIIRVAKENLQKAGCPESEIDFVLEHGGIYHAYENDLPTDEKGEWPYWGVEYLTTD